MLALNKKIEKCRVIPVDRMLPSVGQGSLAIQARSDDKEIFNYTDCINDQQSQIAVHCERVFLYHLNASCKSPISVFCEIIDNKLYFRAKIYDFDGRDEFYIHDYLQLKSDNYSECKQAIEDFSLLMAKKVQQDAMGLLEKICG